jgi:hypothetical protein
VLPGGAPALARLLPADAVRLAAMLDEVPARLVALRELLPPSVDVGALVAAFPEAALLTRAETAAGLEALRAAFLEDVGEGGVADILSTTPHVLCATTLCGVLRGAGHLMPRRQLADSLARRSDWYLQFQTLEHEPRNDFEDVAAAAREGYYRPRGAA